MSRMLSFIGSVMQWGLGGLGGGAIALALIACTPTPSNNNPNGKSGRAASAGDATGGSDKLQVVTSFLPMTQFTQAVAGSCAEVSQILPSNLSPHDYQAKPTDAQRIAQADVLVQNGLGLESFLQPMIENAGNPDLRIIEAAVGLEPMAMAEGSHDHSQASMEGHGEAEHSSAEHQLQEHPQEHPGKEQGSEADHEGEFDPHVWLDPLLAAEQVNHIRDGLIAAAPNCKAEFTANAAAYTEKLNLLNREIQQTLAPFAGKTFVTYHDFANYFAARYGLEVDFLVGVPEENPSPEDVKRVIETAQRSDLKTLLTESESTASPFQALAKDLGVEVSTFRPNEAGGPESLAPDYYFTVMRENAANLAAAFGGAN
jgi:zinc transport system substrate-binding protein